MISQSTYRTGKLGFDVTNCDIKTSRELFRVLLRIDMDDRSRVPRTSGQTNLLDPGHAGHAGFRFGAALRCFDRASEPASSPEFRAISSRFHGSAFNRGNLGFDVAICNIKIRGRRSQKVAPCIHSGRGRDAVQRASEPQGHPGQCRDHARLRPASGNSVPTQRTGVQADRPRRQGGASRHGDPIDFRRDSATDGPAGDTSKGNRIHPSIQVISPNERLPGRIGARRQSQVS